MLTSVSKTEHHYNDIQWVTSDLMKIGGYELFSLSENDLMCQKSMLIIARNKPRIMHIWLIFS